jgi:hypothetical protein
MTDINDLNRNVALGNLASLAQHREAMRQQQEIAEALKKQERERDYQKSLPKCPKCRSPVEPLAERCPSCRTDIVITKSLASDFCKQQLGHSYGVFAEENARNRVTDLVQGLVSNQSSLYQEAKALIERISASCVPLTQLLLHKELLTQYREASAQEKQAEDASKNPGCIFGVAFLFLWIALTVGVLAYVMKASDHKITWYSNGFMFFVYLGVTFVVSAGIVGFLSQLSNDIGGVTAQAAGAEKARKQAREIIRSSLDSKGCKLSFPNDFQSLLKKVKADVALWNKLLKKLSNNASDSRVLGVLCTQLGCDAVALPPDKDLGVLSDVPDEAVAWEEFANLPSTVAVQYRKLFGKDDPRATAKAEVQSQAAKKVTTKAREAAARPSPLIDEAEQILARRGIGVVDARPSSKGAASSTESSSPQRVWVRTPDGKSGGPYTTDQIAKAIAASKIPEGTEVAPSPNGPWKAINFKKS